MRIKSLILVAIVASGCSTPESGTDVVEADQGVPEVHYCASDADCRPGERCGTPLDRDLPRACIPRGFVLVPAGSFIMGARDCYPNDNWEYERPHLVSITRPFVMGESETTKGQWTELMGTPCPPETDELGCHPDRPIRVPAHDAMAYANALSRREGLEVCYDLSGCTGTPGVFHDDSEPYADYQCPDGIGFAVDCEGYRLPTEAEWEYAVRAGTTTMYYSGDGGCDQRICHEGTDPGCEAGCLYPSNSALDEVAWYCRNSRREVHVVKQKEPNAWGLYDMLGNVYEMAWGAWQPYPTEPQVDPVHGDGVDIARGGGVYREPYDCRCASREQLYPGISTGFRLVRTVQ